MPPAATDAPLLELRHVSARYPDAAPDSYALRDVDLTVHAGEVVTVLGPSGGGKSTLLRLVAGLETPSAGAVLLDGLDQRDIPTHRRGVGLMFQDHALFPQRDVAGNIAFGLGTRRRGDRPDPTERRAVVDRLLDLVGLAGYADRPVAALSGGEQQRVALARALAPGPRLLMLDEPLGQLDRALRERLVLELRELFVKLGTTVLAVTHDQGEAFAMSDRVVVMRAGRVVQSGTPQEVWLRPASPFVARFLGFDNVVPVRRIQRGVAETPWGPVPVADPQDPDAAPGPSGRHLLVRPDGVLLAPADAGAGQPHADGPADAPSALRATVVAHTFRGDHVGIVLRPERGPRLEAAARLRDAPPEGATVTVRFDPAETVLLHASPEDSP
ncbi:ABC transporter ATP-binding protein [Allostreptomyces psammosilenae]|uniref:ABC-type quaternary amine transporter n=1 Tax=Allostreptomyces psammosilenae TaxID=1892865 RepID=A0A853AD82_9ACTN|nr:ABC transporter ATP-binding protein [Allostreptomyces psammosilenae]NYI08398.1 thiamine transport system ATP-binding protein [Allostreptomyces psammosilenae]